MLRAWAEDAFFGAAGLKRTTRVFWAHACAQTLSSEYGEGGLAARIATAKQRRKERKSFSPFLAFSWTVLRLGDMGSWTLAEYKEVTRRLAAVLGLGRYEAILPVRRNGVF